MTTPPDQGFHSRVIERRAGLMGVLTTIAILIGGMVEIIPMYLIDDSSMPETEPYTPLEVAGRDIYVAEGCYNCHSQMVRPMRSDVTRYGEWSRAAEYQHDQPFQLGSRRIGPDLAREGGVRVNAWHYRHFEDPRSMTRDSIMPNYPWLLTQKFEVDDVLASMRALRAVGTPYSDEDMSTAAETLESEARAIAADLAAAGIESPWDAKVIALIAYIQSLGTDLESILEAEAGAPQ